MSPVVLATAPLPKQRYFFGRNSEIGQITSFVESDTHHILVIRGVAGIGKTALLVKVVEMYKNVKNIMYTKVYTYTTLPGFLRNLSKFIEQLGRHELQKYLDENKDKIELEGLMAALQSDLSDSNALIVFDDVHYASDEISKILTPLMDVLDATDAKVVVSGRVVPRFYDKRDLLVRQRVAEIVLGGLDERSAIELLKYRGIDETHFKNLYMMTGGHPLMLELAQPQTIGDAAEFIEKEIVEPLSEQERTFLEVASVFRTPFPLDAIGFEAAADVVRKLSEKLLIEEVDGKFELHELFKSIFYARLTAEQKVSYHRKAAEYYLKLKTNEGVLEAIYHLVKGYRQTEAAALAIQNGPALIESGYANALLREISLLEESEIPDYWPYILILRGDIFSKLAKPEVAMKQYDMCVSYTESAKPKGGKEVFSYLWFGVSKEFLKARALAYLRMAELFVAQGKKEEAKDAYGAALKILRDLGASEAFDIEKRMAAL